MHRLTPCILVFLVLLSGTPDLTQAQDLHPSRRPSPVGIAKIHLGNTYVKVTYGRPYLRNRAIFGANTDDTTYLVPFGDVWRTGANEATEITTTGPLLVASALLAAGTYSIFTEPGPAEWVVHFNPQLGLDGTGRLEGDSFIPDVYDTDQDVLVVTVPSGMLDEEVDQFTIALDHTDTGAHLVFRWEKTEVRVPISATS